ncbi:MAG: methyltransferase domain-containing protein [Alphaproteobacteria bacterium]|nr:methyltransferase domain-containing protein [Alphaproteobacteria bacterium]
MTVVEFFNDGDAYERFMGRWSRASGEIFLDWLALPKGLHWLDVGCGTGAFTELLYARCAPSKVEGVDPAEDQLAFARKRPGAAQAEFRQGDAQALPFADGQFDAAAMALVINFVPDPAKAVAEMARVLKPGGTAGAYIWDFHSGGFVQQPLRDAITATGAPLLPNPGPEKATREALQGTFAAAGFQAVETRGIEIDVSYPDFETYWASQTGLPNPAVQSLRKMAEPDVAKLKAGLRDKLTGPGGRVTYPARANAVKGRKPG